MTKFITQPTVRLVGRQQVDETALAAFLSDHDVESWSTDTEVGGEKLVEVAGRLCYMSFAKPRPGGNAAYIGHILDVGHGSVLEHAVFNLIITGVSRSFTHELVRHRAGFGFSQLSQRYVDESVGGLDVVIPPLIQDAELYAEFGQDSTTRTAAREVVAQWKHAVSEAAHRYEKLDKYCGIFLETYLPTLEGTDRKKKAREAARSVLPNCTETKIFVTANARALRHFIEMRADPAADAEIRRVAVAVLKLLKAESPNLFGDYAIVGDIALTNHKKV